MRMDERLEALEGQRIDLDLETQLEKAAKLQGQGKPV